MADVNKKDLDTFWQGVKKEITEMDKKNVKKLPLPATRIKKIMKIDKDVKLISSETPLLLAKASEIFMRELTLKSWHETKDQKRTTLQKSDIVAAMKKDEMYDFLVDIVPGKTTNLTVFEIGHTTKKIVKDNEVRQMAFTRQEPAPKQTNKGKLSCFLRNIRRGRKFRQQIIQKIPSAPVVATEDGDKENIPPESGRVRRMFRTELA